MAGKKNQRIRDERKAGPSIMVTHDPVIASYAHTIIELKDVQQITSKTTKQRR